MTLIPYLEKRYHVIAVSTDGFDDTGKTTFTTAEKSAEKLATYINENLGGRIKLVFGESFGSATAVMLFNNTSVRTDLLIIGSVKHEQRRLIHADPGAFFFCIITGTE